MITVTVSAPNAPDFVTTMNEQQSVSGEATVITVSTINIPNGTTVTAALGAPVNQSYTNTVLGNQTLISIPDADLPETAAPSNATIVSVSASGGYTGSTSPASIQSVTASGGYTGTV